MCAGHNHALRGSMVRIVGLVCNGRRNRSVRCDAGREEERRNSISRFLTLGKQADQILQAAAPAIDRLGPIRLNHVGSWKLVAAGSMT